MKRRRSVKNSLISLLQAALNDILPPLRLLKSKTRLQFADLQYILSTNPVLCASEATILLGRLMMVFLCDAVGGHLVFNNVVQMVSRDFDFFSPWFFFFLTLFIESKGM